MLGSTLASNPLDNNNYAGGSIVVSCPGQSSNAAAGFTYTGGFNIIVGSPPGWMPDMDNLVTVSSYGQIPLILLRADMTTVANLWS